MKLAIIITFFAAATAFPGLSSVKIWLASFQQPILNLIDNPLRRSTIPRFILDTKHPWILTNQRKLESLPDAEAFLCLGPNPEFPGKKIDTRGVDLEVPADLFDALNIGNSSYTISRPGWPNAVERLTEIKQCPKALSQAKSLDVNVYVHCQKYDDYWLWALEPSQLPPQVVTLFGDVLQFMTSLESLKWGINADSAPFFEESFKARNLTLPSVTSLYPRLSNHYLVGMCPNLERLESVGDFSWYGWSTDGLDRRTRLIQSGASAHKLRRFAMTASSHEGWTPDLASKVVKSMPGIESLELSGSLGREPDYSDNDGKDSGKLKAILDVLADLKNLSHLDLPASWGLGVGFNGGPTCGNAYDGTEGDFYARQVTRESVEAKSKASDIVMANAPYLKSFSIGGKRPNITRAEDGTQKAIWPWTGRLKDWLKEEFPDLPDIGDMDYYAMGSGDIDEWFTKYEAEKDRASVQEVDL